MEASQTDIDAAIDKISPFLPALKWPSEAINTLLSRTLTIGKGNKQWALVLSCTLPWGGGPRSLKLPAVSALPNLTEGSRIQVFLKVWYRETVLAVAAKGSDGMADLKIICPLQKDEFEKFDALDMTTAGLPVLKEQIELANCLLSLVDFSYGLQWKDWLKNIICFKFCA